jgi:TusA-related sulfurtransferase
MKKLFIAIAMIALFFVAFHSWRSALAAGNILPQDTKKAGATECPGMPSGAKSEMEMLGDQAMGFDQRATTHHFKLVDNGGEIEVQANNSSDTKSIEEIQLHLSHIAVLFQQGNFNVPMFVHNAVPPGVELMKRYKSLIAYTFEKLPAGGVVHIRTDDPRAKSAIYEFLKFQITEHKTGDTVTAQP